jgi:hypothetical protein
MGDPGRLTGGRPKGRGTFTGRQLNAWSVRQHPEHPLPFFALRFTAPIEPRAIFGRASGLHRIIPVPPHVLVLKGRPGSGGLR